MNVALVSNYELNYDTAPASRVLSLGEALQNNGFTVIVIGIRPENNVDKEKVRKILLRRYDKPGSFGWHLYQHYLPLKVLLVLLRNEADFLILRGHYFGAYLSPILKVLKKKVIYDFHGYLYLEQQANFANLRSWLITSYTKLLEKIALKMADRVLVVSDGVRKALPEKYLVKAISLQNGVNIEEYGEEINESQLRIVYDKYNIDRRAKKIGFIGNNKPWFRMEDMIELNQYLRDDYQIIIVGSGYDVNSKKRNERLKFIGCVPHDDVSVILEGILDICIVPYNEMWHDSNTEGFFSSRKVTEYLAAGKPIIVADIKGKPPFLKENENCLTYKSGDSKDLAEKIQQLMSDKELYKRMCDNNRLLAQKFSWGNILKESGLIEYLRRGG